MWSITSSFNVLTGHVVVEGNQNVYETEVLLQKVEHMLEHKGIKHVTLQVESEKHLHDSSVLCVVKADQPDAHAHHSH